MYSQLMRRLSKFVFAFGCLSFLTITLSGFHLHADDGGHGDAAPHTHDVHQAIDHDLDQHGKHVDLQVFEPATGFSKFELFVASWPIPELAIQATEDMRWPDDPPVAVSYRDFRLRPFLRAPPASV